VFNDVWTGRIPGILRVENGVPPDREVPRMEGRQVVTSDAEGLGTVLAERGDCVIVEMGHIFKSKHAIPNDFLHEHEDGVLHATVAKDVVSGSPKVDVDRFDRGEIRRHYGLDVEFENETDEIG
jgi:hypothetical protein